MSSRLRARMSFANVVSVLALFAALGGSAYAAGVLPVNSVGGPQLKKDAVTGAKVKDGSLKAADFAAGALRAGPKGDSGPRGAAGPSGPAGPAGAIDSVLYYSKVQSDARYLRTAGVITVSTGTITIGNNTYNGAVANCPAGYEAIAGGVDTSSGQDTVVSVSAPMVAGAPTRDLSAGTHGPPTGWSGYVRNNSANSQFFAVVAICAPLS